MATQYIGSRISLISKNEIRYEGTLYSIDPNKLEVVLQNVQSFGTEDRVTDNPVASQNCVYGFISFSGQDIKTLDVCEEAPPMGMPGPDMGFMNPYGYPPQGYMMPGQYPGYGYPNPYQQPYGYPYGYDPRDPYGYQQGFNPELMNPEQQGAMPPGVSPSNMDSDNNSATISKEEISNESKENQSEKKLEPTVDQSTTSNSTNGEKQTPKKIQKDDNISHKNHPETNSQKPTPSLSETKQPEQSTVSSDKSNTNDNQSRNKSRGGKRGRGRQPYDRQGGRSTRGGKSKSTQEAYKEDFDFESSLAKFDKAKFAAELIDGKESADFDEDVSDLTLAYEKSSFFDSISCEATDREAEREKSTDYRETLKQQRKLDTETFGESSRNNRGRNRRYYNRGRRGNSNYRKRQNNSHNNGQQSSSNSN